MASTAPYGSWASPITAARLAERTTGLAQPVVDGDELYWLESRPTDGGRQVVVRAEAAAGSVLDVLPPPYSARTLVHEYGGGDFTVHRGTLFFSNFEDQRLYRVDPGGTPRPITPAPDRPRALRYADARISPDGRWLVCVREQHHGERAVDVVNELVALPTDGSEPPHVVASGCDFYAAPRFDADGARLAWYSWDHPRMPWDGTELWVADLDDGVRPAEPRLVAGGPEESAIHPVWGPGGELYFASDRTGWWNLYEDDGRGGRPLLAPVEAEFAGPPWSFGQSSFVVLGDGTLACTWLQDGTSRLGILDPVDGTLRPVDVGFSAVGTIKRWADGVVALAAGTTHPVELAAVDLRDGSHRTVRASTPEVPDPRWISEPEPIEFPTTNGLTARAFFYAPTNPDFAAPDGERPPLLVISHGGPTSAASPTLNLAIQFWTTRGIAVVDVNYGGSVGFGRAYRERLKGTWGITDVDDCVSAARYLVARGDVDGARLAIRGGSAGGYTTLCALAFRPGMFAAGASYYGVADAAALAAETHKFESRYLDGLIGPYPEAKDVYHERSPIHFADRITSPLILLQGLEDAVVPPAQAEHMLAAVRANGLPVAYVAFAEERHGFRKAENMVRAIEAELFFYGRVLGFTPADDIDPVPIENL